MNDNSQDASAKSTLSTLRDHAWEYFELHAEQRLKTFHFFIILETGLLGALLLLTRTTPAPAPHLVATTGAMVALFAFVFWKLDFRTKGMIKVAEEALKHFERIAVAEYGDAQFGRLMPFSNDPQVLGLVVVNPFGTLSYSKCFGVVFCTFGIVGAALVIRSLSN